MSRTEWIKLLGLVGVAIVGALYIGELSGRVNTMNPEAAITRINAARDAVLEDIERMNEGFSDPTSLISRVYEWREGQQAVQMIRVSEGICYLVFVRGRFQGGGESVTIYESGDYWFLHGASQQRPGEVAGNARCWRFPTVGAE